MKSVYAFFAWLSYPNETQSPPCASSAAMHALSVTADCG